MNAPSSEFSPQEGQSSTGASSRQSTHASQSGGSKRRNRDHTNSRSGCHQCKARKVKASTTVPNLRTWSLIPMESATKKDPSVGLGMSFSEAANRLFRLLIGRNMLIATLASSTRRAAPCTYPNEINGLNQLASAASAASSSDRSDGSNFPNSQVIGSCTPTPQESRTIPPKNDSTGANGPRRIAAPSPSTLDLAHLELLHHFIAVTSHAISFGSLGYDVWHMIVPKIALSHDWLMHSILAISALHIAHLNPDQRHTYRKRAANHEDHALQGQRRALANPSIHNGDALFAFTLTIIYLAFAAHDASESAEEAPLQGLVRCLHMLRGIRAISSTVKPFVEQGPLAPMLLLHPGNIKSNSAFSDPITEAHFARLLIFSSTSSDLNDDQGMDDVENYPAAANSLRASFLKVEAIPNGESTTPPIWHWAVRLPTSFIVRLGEKHTVPLILVAHWCVLLVQFDRHWWMRGWVDQKLDEIRYCLPRESHEWMRWPEDQIREIRAKQVTDGL